MPQHLGCTKDIAICMVCYKKRSDMEVIRWPPAPGYTNSSDTTVWVGERGGQNRVGWVRAGLAWWQVWKMGESGPGRGRNGGNSTTMSPSLFPDSMPRWTELDCQCPKAVHMTISAWVLMDFLKVIITTPRRHGLLPSDLPFMPCLFVESQ